jgi:hypothetical protein
MPKTENQFGMTFDTMSCATFSALNCIETQMNYLLKNNLLSVKQKQFLVDGGYIDNENKVNFSDRFTAIMSGTTEMGNSFVKVWDSIRKDGLLPESKFIFGGNTFADYHNPVNITENMKVNAKKFLDYFDVQYEWVLNVQSAPEDSLKISEAIKMSPLNIAIHSGGYHAVEMLQADQNQHYRYFDTYPTYVFDRTLMGQPVMFALRGVVESKNNVVIEYPYFVFNKNLTYGNINNDVTMLQKMLIAEGLLKTQATGNFLNRTRDAVKAFQTKYGIPSTGNFMELTRKKATELCSKKKF